MARSLITMIFLTVSYLCFAEPPLKAEPGVLADKTDVSISGQLLKAPKEVNPDQCASCAGKREMGFWALLDGLVNSSKASITKLGAFVVAVLLVCAGIWMFKVMKPEHPAAPYSFELLAITFILPVLLIVGILTEKGQEAVVGIIGTIVGYVFAMKKNRVEGRAKVESGDVTVDAPKSHG